MSCHTTSKGSERQDGVTSFASLNSRRYNKPGIMAGSFLTLAAAVIEEKAEAPLMMKFCGSFGHHLCQLNPKSL